MHSKHIVLFCFLRYESYPQTQLIMHMQILHNLKYKHFLNILNIAYSTLPLFVHQLMDILCFCVLPRIEILLSSEWSSHLSRILSCLPTLDLKWFP